MLNVGDAKFLALNQTKRVRFELIRKTKLSPKSKFFENQIRFLSATEDMVC